MKTSPPQVITDYFTAANEGSIDDTAACFTADALVHDENQDRRGMEAIRAWIEESTLKYHPQVVVNEISAEAEAFTATGHVSGDFPGSPIPLHYTFTLRDEKISQLTIQ